MNGAIERRLRKLESTRRDHGRRVLISMLPLPDDASEREAAIDALLASGEARLRGGILTRARRMTTEEWLAEFAPGRNDLLARGSLLHSA